MNIPFEGFEPPSENWSKLPHAMINNLCIVETLAEMKVILYVLRHTWGFQEFDELKRITLDEFQNGRKRKDGSRIDGGTGLSVNAIKDGIARAIEHGFLIQQSDERDAGRQSHCYALNMSDRVSKVDRVSEVDTLGVKVCYPGCQSLIPRVSEVDTRTEKDTPDRNPEKDTMKDTHGDADVAALAAPPVEKKTAAQDALRKALELKFCELTNIPRPKTETRAQKNSAGSLWFAPLREIAELAAWNEYDALSLLEASVKHLRGQVTISNPNSLLKTARAIAAGTAPGATWKRETPPAPRRITVKTVNPVTGTIEEMEVNA